MGDSIDSIRAQIAVTIRNRQTAITLSDEIVQAGLQFGKDFPQYKDTRYLSVINTLEYFIKAEMDDLEILEKKLKELLKAK